MHIGVRIAVVIISCFLIGGCMFFGLREDVKLLEAATTISGTIKTTSPRDKPIFVALYQPEGNDRPRLAAYSVMYGSGEFKFLRSQGDYYLIAFEDANEDFTFQHNEYVGWYGTPTLIQARPGVNFTDLAVVLRPPEQAQQELPELYAPSIPAVSMKLDDRKLGEIVQLNDPRFSPQVGALGMWEPVKFFQQGLSGLFFFETYHSDKIPVLFIHGISSSGHDWRYLIAQLDRTRFQPWVFQYPSGLRLELLSEALHKAVTELQVEHKFNTLFVIAHSMGGLVAQGFINRNVSQNNQSLIKLFVTISTPWQGHTSARTGVARAPVVVPSWYDMVPGSPYIQSLFSQPLPDHLPYYLIFSHRGTQRLISRDNTDGTITLRSQLPLVAQDRAIKVLGYDEGHVSILHSEAVSKRLHEIMTAAQNASRLSHPRR